MNKEERVSLLLKDLERLHIESTITLSDEDGKVINKINKNGLETDKLVYETRNNLWLGYTEEILNLIEDMINNLSKSFVKVKEFRIKLQEIKRNVNTTKIKNYDKNELQSIQKNFKDAMVLWNELIVSENDLKNEGLMNFLVRIFLPIAGGITAIYGWIIFQYFKLENLFNIGIIYLVLMFITYNILRKISTRYPKEENTDEK